MAAHIAGKAPLPVEVEAVRSYWWCACGLSQNQPFCDGSHKSTDIVPLEYKAGKDATLWFCACKQTGRQPLCDGTHNCL